MRRLHRILLTGLLWASTTATGQIYGPFDEQPQQIYVPETTPAIYEFQSVSSMQSNYNVPFAADDLGQVGEATPPGRRKSTSPPWIPGGGGNDVDKPGFNDTLTDGTWVLALCAAAYACCLLRKRRRTTGKERGTKNYKQTTL